MKPQLADLSKKCIGRYAGALDAAGQRLKRRVSLLTCFGAGEYLKNAWMMTAKPSSKVFLGGSRPL